MPTGYTHKVQKGEVTDLRTFALECARAFGACVELRDDPKAPIPEAFAPSDYYVRSMAEKRAEVARLYSMTPDEAAIACATDHDQRVEAYHKRRAEKAAERKRYEAMIALVRAWEPPTKEHGGLQSFMLEQLHTSIDFDCFPDHDREPKREPADVWLAKARAEADKNLARASKNHAEEVKRAASRTAWIKALRASLPSPSTQEAEAPTTQQGGE
jgi:hypothetical protein